MKKILPIPMFLLLSMSMNSRGANLVGLWEFDDPTNPAKATVGTDLLFEGTPPKQVSYSTDGGGTALYGTITTAAALNSNRIRAVHGISPNGGGTRVNQYSVVVDIFSCPGSQSSWRTIFQTDLTNTDDGDYFINPAGNLGTAYLGYSTGAIDTTSSTRLVLTFDTTKNGGDAIAYLDGTPFQTHSRDIDPDDFRFTLDSSLYFFTDNDGENGLLTVGALAIYEGALTPAEVAALGTADSQIGPAAPKSPLLHLPLDGDALDVSGNGHHGTPSAGLTYGPGKVGGAAVFNGAQKIDFDPFLVDASEYTMTGFFSTSSVATQAIIGFGETISSLQVSNSPIPGSLRFIDRPGGGNTGGISVFTPTPYSDGAFHHFAIRKSGTSSKIFVDGAEVASGNGSAGTFSGLTDFVLGQNSPNSAARFFIGSLDEIRVYGSALSDAEIAALASAADPTFRITYFHYDRAVRTVDLTFHSEHCVSYVIEISTDGKVWSELGNPVLGVDGAETTTVSDLALPASITDHLLLRVKRPLQ